MPTVNLSYGKQVNQGTAQNDYVTQLSVSIPIFSGGSASAAVQQASYQLQAAELGLTELRLTLREKLLVSWSEWVSAKNRSQLGRQQVKTGEALVDGYFKQYQVGRRSILDLLNIQADSYSYQTNAIIATFDERASRARVQAAQGRLAASYIGKRNNNVSGGPDGNLAARPTPALLSSAIQPALGVDPPQSIAPEATMPVVTQKPTATDSVGMLSN